MQHNPEMTCKSSEFMRNTEIFFVIILSHFIMSLSWAESNDAKIEGNTNAPKSEANRLCVEKAVGICYMCLINSILNI